MARLLYLHPGLVPPPANPEMDKFYYLSEIMEGESLLPLWFKDEESAAANMKDRFPVSRVGRFRHHFYAAGSLSGAARTFSQIRYSVRKGLELHREKKFDYVMTYGTNAPGIAGMILSSLTGAKLIPDLPNAPEHQYLFEEPVRTFGTHVKKALSDILLHTVISRSAMVKLLYPQQLDHYPLLRRRKSFVCHDFVPVRHLAASLPEPVQPTVLVVGHPWYRKGIDLAVLGFRKIASRFPRHKLVIVGWMPDRTHIDRLVGDCSQIEIRRPVPAADALKLISSCEVYLSASRSEGLARVLMEAMALGRPVLASATNGSPHLIEDGRSGLLFRREDPDHLAAQLATLLEDPDFAGGLARAGRQRILQHFDENAYIRNFVHMIESLGGQPAMDATAVDRG